MRKITTDSLNWFWEKGVKPIKDKVENLKNTMDTMLKISEIVNNCVTDNPDLPLAAAQGKFLMDLYTQLYSDIQDGVSVRYNKETDYIQALFDGMWHNVLSAKIQAFYLFAEGKGFQNNILINPNTYCNIDSSINFIKLSTKNSTQTMSATFNIKLTEYIGKNKKISLTYKITNTNTKLISYASAIPSSEQKTTVTIPVAKDRTVYEISVDNILDYEHGYLGILQTANSSECYIYDLCII